MASQKIFVMGLQEQILKKILVGISAGIKEFLEECLKKPWEEFPKQFQ